MDKIIFQNYHKHSYWTNIKVSDSTTSLEEYCKRAKELGHGIISSVEHGWQGHYIECHQLAEKYGLKFLFGTEAYWVKDRLSVDEAGHKDGSNCHICLLAMNENGRQAINDILSQAAIDGYYRQSRIDLPLIMSLPANDVIVTTACVAGWKYDDIEDIYLKMFQHFGNNFYLEVQYHNTEVQKELNKRILKLHDKYNFPIIMGCDSHYIDEKGKNDRDEFIKSKGMDYPDEDGWYMDYPDGETAYNRFAEQCVLSHDEIMEAINNTNVFLNVEEYDCPIFNHDIKMPTLYPNLSQEEKDALFENIIWDEWDKYKVEVPMEKWEHYKEEIRNEVDIVKTTFHSDYFLLDYNIAKLGKEKGGVLTLTSRGSAPSFFITKLLGFTSIDRIAAKVHMYPERFMSPTRILETHSLADIDMNVAKQEPFWEAQEELLGYEHSKQMIAFQQLKPPAAWKMYAKSQNIDFETANTVSGFIKKWQKAVAHAEEDEKDTIDIMDYIPKEYQEIYEKSVDYLGVISAVTPHACGSLIYQGDIRKEIGYIYVKSQSSDGMICCCMDGKWAEKYGFLKNDWLKVNVVEVIYDIFKRIGIEPIPSNELIKICTPENKVWDIYKNQCTKGINQVEGEGTASRAAKYKPKNISELTAFVAAIRPGFKTMYKKFESREPFNYGVKSFDSLIATDEMPDSFVLYQEQVMATLHYAGIPMSECYGIIKSIAKKRVEEVYKYKEIFMDNFSKALVNNENMTKEQADSMTDNIWKIIEANASYSFNCISGNEKLKREIGKSSYTPTIKEMYMIKNDSAYAKKTGHRALHDKYKREGYGKALSLCEDGRIRKNNIVDIYPMGVQQTYRVYTELGSTIECTIDHKFPTPLGDTKLSDLKVGDVIYKCGSYEKDTTKYAFTNGNYKSNIPLKGQKGFQTNENGDSVVYYRTRNEKLKAKCKCECCGVEYSDNIRFELHHSDFDRTNNSEENYEWLCVSCHKRKHYNYNRIRKGQKGYPVLQDRILAIEYIGEQEVFDIEMEHPNHTFVMEDGLVVCNCSHSYSVALDSLYGSYLKTYYPLEFYETYLNILNKKGDKDRLNAFKQEAEHYFNIAFPPFRYKQDNRSIILDKEHNAINNALSSIKGYSDIIAEALYQCSIEANDDFISVLKWLDNHSIKSAKIIPLIKIGYFNEYGNENSLLKFIEFWDIFKQGDAKSLNKEKVTEEISRYIDKYATDKNKDGSEAKAWKITDCISLLNDLYNDCLWIEEPTYSERMSWQEEVLGYIELTTNKPEDTKKVLILDIKPLIGQYSEEPWCYKIETRSIGTGRTASLNIDKKTWQRLGSLEKMDIIEVTKINKNKSGYWYIYDYKKLHQK